jgi:membrane-bound inhibitor of C-type lysozyme
MRGRTRIAAAALCALSACANLPPPTTEQLSNMRQVYVCPDGATFTAEFDEKARDVRLTLADGQQYVLQRVASTDALVRFSNGTIQFGTDGRQAGVADQIRLVHQGCRAR